MKLQLAYTNRGFTLIEILVVMGIVGILFVAGSFMDIGSIGRSLRASEHATLISILQTARGRAMNNIYASAHGVHVEDDEYVLFREFPYSESESTNEAFPRNENVTISATANLLDADDEIEVVFEQLSGEPENTGDITVEDTVPPKEIRILANGLIDW